MTMLERVIRKANAVFPEHVARLPSSSISSRISRSTTGKNLAANRLDSITLTPAEDLTEQAACQQRVPLLFGQAYWRQPLEGNTSRCASVSFLLKTNGFDRPRFMGRRSPSAEQDSLRCSAQERILQDVLIGVLRSIPARRTDGDRTS
jgi:hypothetical protein